MNLNLPPWASADIIPETVESVPFGLHRTGAFFVRVVVAPDVPAPDREAAERLIDRIVKLARAAVPHRCVPSAQLMGDCGICGCPIRHEVHTP